MVALKKYARIEAAGLWRASPEAQRREVIVTLGDASLTVKAMNDQPLAHWSIAAIARRNPGQRPALYHPDGDPGEELELPENEAEMIDAIETLRRAVDRARPKPGRLRGAGLALSLLAVLWALFFWLPGALRDHTLRVVPDVARQEIGTALLTRIQRVTGPACATTATRSVLARLGERLDAPRLAIMRGGLAEALRLPGGLILLSRTLVEDHEDPAVVAGYVLAETAHSTDPLETLLHHAGPLATFRLLTTGALPEGALDAYAEHLLAVPDQPAAEAALLARFAAAQVTSTPYAYARDVTGETTLSLIEADPLRGNTASPEILSDGDWVRLQAICSN